MPVVTLTGATVEWLHWNSSWGNTNGGGDSETDRETRVLVLASPFRKVGKGHQHKVDLTKDQIDSLWEIVNSIAAFGESCDAEERGEDAYNYRALRRDANRMKEL